MILHLAQVRRCKKPSKAQGLCGAFFDVMDVFMNVFGSVQSRKFKSGFTLIELMVVLVIIGILAALIVPNVLDRADDARVTAAKTDVNNIMQALKLYRLDNQRYPSSAQGLVALTAKPTTEPVPPNWRPYLDKLPNDPWGRPYQYLNPGLHGEIDVLSLGADGQAGGEGKDADIGSWQP
jgi:general secretion pathway protein G